MKKTVGITFSAFDLFHAGHVLMLEEAKQQCDWLIVGLQTDPTVDRPEKNKPVQTVFERFAQVRACKFVDEIIPYETEADLITILTTRDIDVRIIGEEYRKKDFTGNKLPIKIHYNKRQHNLSSSTLRERLK